MTFCAAAAAWSWAVAAFISASGLEHALGYANFFYGSGFAIAVTVQLFAAYWLHSKLRAWFFVILAGLLVLEICLTILFPHILVRSIHFDGRAKSVVLNPPVYGVYLLVFLALFGSALARLWNGLQNMDRLKRSQTGFIIAGLLSAGSLGIWFNLLWPLFGHYRTIWVGPLWSVLFISFTGYAIVRRKLFDVRVAAARAVAYLASVLVLSAVYGFVIFGLAQTLLGLELSFSTQALLSVGTGIISLSFGYVKKNFDRATEHLFFHDRYNPQELFDRMNKILVASVGLDELLGQVSQLIGDNFKASFCFVGVTSADDEGGYRIRGTTDWHFASKDIEYVRELTPHIHQNVIVVDDLPESQKSLQAMLAQNGIAVLVRLTPDPTHTKEGFGYLVLGAKKSGAPYVQQDASLLDTVANELVIATENALRFDEIQSFNVTLQEKVDAATKQLRHANERLKSMDETKDDFISMASHQLRTPLTSVKGYLSLVLDGDAGKISPTQQKLLSQAFISSQRMVFLIADLLNVSRLKTGKFIIEKTMLNLADIAVEEVNQLQETAASRELQLIYHKPADFPAIELDETKTRQVIMNFIDNAIYYTPQGGKIKVELEASKKSVSLKVVDDGIGVPKSEAHHLFTKFYRAQNAQKARPDGTGLGLFMAKKVIIAQGGAIIFDSKEGKGSTFGFTMPLTPQSSDEAAPLPAKATLQA
jgi:signal transduction histidine kinase